MNTDDLQAKQTVNIQTCRDLLHKLERDLNRLADAKSRDDVSDCAFNAIVTASHMLDWVARDILIERLTQRSKNTSPDGTKDLPVTGNTHGAMQTSLRKHVYSLCPEMHVCRTFANASKHGTPGDKYALDGFSVSVGVGTMPAAFDEDGNIVSGPLTQKDFENSEYVVSVHVRESDVGPYKSYEAVQLISNVYEFWAGLIYQHQIG